MKMNAGKQPQLKAQFKTKNRDGDLTEKIQELQKRLERLEHLVLNQGHPFSAPREIIVTKPGPKPRWNPREILSRRDGLYDFCGLWWPELSSAIRKARSPKQLEKFLQGHNLKIGKYWQADHLTEHSAILWEFIHSGRYHGDPLQIANALAGVPGLAWRTSWNICREKSPGLMLHRRAHRDHLKRKFPERLRELLGTKNVDKISEILQRARTEDRIILLLRKIPEQVPEILKDGEPKSLPT